MVISIGSWSRWPLTMMASPYSTTMTAMMLAFVKGTDTLATSYHDGAPLIGQNGPCILVTMVPVFRHLGPYTEGCCGYQIRAILTKDGSLNSLKLSGILRSICPLRCVRFLPIILQIIDRFLKNTYHHEQNNYICPV